MRTKLFCDITELDLIKKFDKIKVVKGFIINSNVMRKNEAEDFKSYSKYFLKTYKISLTHWGIY